MDKQREFFDGVGRDLLEGLPEEQHPAAMALLASYERTATSYAALVTTELTEALAAAQLEIMMLAQMCIDAGYVSDNALPPVGPSSDNRELHEELIRLQIKLAKAESKISKMSTMLVDMGLVNINETFDEPEEPMTMENQKPSSSLFGIDIESDTENT